MPGDYEKLLENVYFTKDKAFEYEKEYRLLAYEKAGEKSDHMAIDFSYLVRVTFGMHCGKSTRDLVQCAAEYAYGTGKVEFYEVNAELEEKEYGHSK